MRALHDRPEHVEAADVEPALVGPALERAAEDVGRELAGVGPAGLVGAGAEVADDLAPLGVQRGHDARVVVEEVDVVHLGLDRLVDRGRQLPLPGRAGRGPPDAGGRLLGLRGVGRGHGLAGGADRDEREAIDSHRALAAASALGVGDPQADLVPSGRERARHRARCPAPPRDLLGERPPAVDGDLELRGPLAPLAARDHDEPHLLAEPEGLARLALAGQHERPLAGRLLVLDDLARALGDVHALGLDGLCRRCRRGGDERHQQAGDDGEGQATPRTRAGTTLASTMSEHE